MTFVLFSGLLILCVGGLIQSTYDERHDRGSSAQGWLALGAPMIALVIALSALNDFVAQICEHGLAIWPSVAIGMLSLITLVVIGSTVLWVMRLAVASLITHRTTARQLLGDDERYLQALVDDVTRQLRAPSVRLVMYDSDEAMAQTGGLFRPWLLMSTWFLRNLNHLELRAVIAHEVGHVLRRDYARTWLALVLRDSFWYLAASHSAYRNLCLAAEQACDDIAVQITGDSLSVASALAKVWRASLTSPLLPAPFRSIWEPDNELELRIVRLLAWMDSPSSDASRSVGCVSAAPMALCLALLSSINVAIMLGRFGCAPITQLCALATCS